MTKSQLFRLGVRQRLAAAAGAVITGSGLVVAVVGAFVHVSSPPWLPATPEILMLAAACDAKATRAERDACRRDLVAGAGTPRPQGTRVASGPREPRRSPVAR